MTFLLVAFIVSCCMMLFVSTLADIMYLLSFALTREFATPANSEAFSLATVPCMIIGSLLVPVISKRTGKKKALIGIMGVNLVASAVFYLVGYSNVVTVIICNAIQTTCVGAAMVLINSMNADTIEYGEWITGQRNEGVITSTRTLVVKIASTIQGITLATVLA